MKIGIQIKAVVIYICTIIIIMLVSGTYIIYSTEQRDYMDMQTKIESMAEHIELRMNWNLEEIKSQIDEEYEIYILNQEGIVETKTTGKIDEGEVIREEVVIRALSTRKSATASRKKFSILIQEEYIDHARVVMDNYDEETITNIIYIRASTRGIYQNITNIMKTIGVGLVLAMVISIFCGIVFANMITSPIKKLTTSSKKLAEGRSISHIPVEAADEIGELTKSFNYMANQLGISMAEVSSEKNKLQKIFEHMADGVMAFNTQGALIHLNSVCYEMIGENARGNNFEEIFRNINIKTKFEEILSSKPMNNNDETIVVGDKYLKIYFDAYLNSRREKDGIVIVIQDVTKQQKLDSMRKEFVANVSHELRTPLTTVKSYTETLIDGAIDDKKMALHFLGVMAKEADRMTDLVQDLLELSRIDNKQIQLNFKKINLKLLLEEVLEAQYIHIIKKEHRLETNYDKSAEYWIYGDVVRIRQVMHNILSNAIKYSPNGGNIGVKIIDKNDRIKVVISDTGMGIPKEDLDRIFERFYRVDKARSREMGGTGLGLSIARELMQLHNGDIHITSVYGQGTEVTLDFALNSVQNDI